MLAVLRSGVEEAHMSRDENAAVVDRFFAGIVAKDLTRLPIDPDLTVESPLVPKVRGEAAMEYLRRVAASVTAIRVEQHIVEGEWVATLFEEETVNGPLTVFAKFHVVAGRIMDVAVFYDPRRLATST
jgi:hypothetical protein